MSGMCCSGLSMSRMSWKRNEPPSFQACVLPGAAGAESAAEGIHSDMPTLIVGGCMVQLVKHTPCQLGTCFKSAVFPETPATSGKICGGACGHRGKKRRRDLPPVTSATLSDDMI